jgi:hypothetical protein
VRAHQQRTAPLPFKETTMSTSNTANRTDVYTRVTNKIVADLEIGVRTWMKPWSVTHTAGKISRPLRQSGQPYNGVNVLLLWAEAVENGYVAPIWMTYKQATALRAHVRQGEHGSMVVYADRFNKTAVDDNGNETEAAIPFLKAYTVFNVEQIEGLPQHYYARPEQRLSSSARINDAERFIANTQAAIRHGGNMAFTRVMETAFSFRHSKALPMPRATMRLPCTSLRTGRSTRRASTATSGESASATRAMPRKNSWQSWARRFYALIWALRRSFAMITRRIFNTG